MALYYTKGTISHMSEVTTGTSKNGREWARMSIMLDVPGFQGSITKVIFQVGTDRIDNVLEYKVGDKVEIGWSIYAREWNDKWYNNVELVNIKSADAQRSIPLPAEEPAQAEDLEPQEGDLPF